MFVFNGLDQILMAVIKSTSHSDKRKTDEKRFDGVMQALFGDVVEDFHIATPNDIPQRDILRILHLQKIKKISLRKAMREVLSEKVARLFDIENDAEFERQLEAYVDRLKKHLSANKGYYDKFPTIMSNRDISDDPYLSSEDKERLLEDRHDIFAALNKAGWHI